MYCITYYSSYIYLFASVYSYICLNTHCLTCVTFFLFLTSITYHSDKNNVIKLRIDEITVRITTLSYMYYFFDCRVLWFAVVYMLCCHYILKPLYSHYCDIIHSSFHIVTGFTMIYLVYYV